MPQLVYQAFGKTYSGDSAADIVQQLYEHSKLGYGPELTKEKWWDYQRTVWKLKEGKNLPASLDELGAAEAFIDFALDMGVLEEGPKHG